MKFWILALIFSTEMIASAFEGRVYITKAGDTLSAVALKCVGSPVYGKQGALLKVLKLNPKIKNPDLIVLNRKILIPRSSFENAVEPSKPPKPSRSLSQFQSVPESQELSKISSSSRIASSRFKIETGLTYFRLNLMDLANGGSSVLLSEVAPIGRLEWHLDWGTEWSSIMGFEIESYAVMGDDSSNPKQIASARGTLLGSTFAISKKLSSHEQLAMRIKFLEKVFTHSESLTIIALDKIIVPTLAVNYQRRIFEVDTAAILLGGEVEYLFASPGPGYTVKNGHGFKVFSEIQHRLRLGTLSGVLKFATQNQNSSLVDRNQTDISMALGFSIPLSSQPSELKKLP